MTTTEKLQSLFEDCLASPGDPAMIGPMLKTAEVLSDADLKAIAGGPFIVNEVANHQRLNPFINN